MKSFLTKDKKPLHKWKYQPDGIMYRGKVPDGYKLAIVPSEGMIVVDIDRHGEKDGFKNIPEDIYNELCLTFNYETKNNGMHCFFYYTGNKVLANKASNLGIDLRTDRGYVCYYRDDDIRDNIHLIKKSSPLMNEWIESIFKAKTKLKR